MTKREKLIQRILARPPEASFSDVRAVLEEFGWTLERTRGSHNYFTKPGEPTLSIPVTGGKRVKGIYLKIVIHRLELED